MLLLSTSPGPRGAATVMESGIATFPRIGAQLAASFSLPSFYEQFSKNGIKDLTHSSHLSDAISAFANALNQ